MQSVPETVLNEYNPKAYRFILHGDKILINKSGNKTLIPVIETPGPDKHENITLHHVGYYSGIPCFASELKDQDNLPENFKLTGIRKLYDKIDGILFNIALKSLHIIHWDKTHKYCGCCGNLMEHMTSERAKKCTVCGDIVFPRISPAVIAAIVKGNELLLAHAKRFKRDLYSVIAGFVEPGESLEECLKREIMEETGLTVKNISYFGSQPWPFPDSLMIAFTAEYAGGELKIDQNEITDAKWFTVKNLPVFPPGYSIAKRLIDWFAFNYSK